MGKGIEDELLVIAEGYVLATNGFTLGRVGHSGFDSGGFVHEKEIHEP
jgi:hypothetical protein